MTVIASGDMVTLNQVSAVGFVPTVGRVSVTTPTLLKPTTYQVEKIAERKSGRPFGIAAGRARTKLVR